MGHSEQLSFWPFQHLDFSVLSSNSLVILSPFQYSPTTFCIFSLIRDSKMLTNQASGFTISSDHLECLLSSISALHSPARFASASLPLSVPVPFCPLTRPLAKTAAAADSLVFLSVVSSLCLSLCFCSYYYQRKETGHCYIRSLHCPETFIRSSVFNSLIDTCAFSLSALPPIPSLMISLSSPLY